MKKFFFIFLIFTLFPVNGQEYKSTYIKGNAALLPLGILNIAAEHQISDKYTVQGEVFISPWKSYLGHYMQVYSIGLDGRYYFKEAFKNWYIGANISGARFIMQKWNYWSGGIFQYSETSPVYNISDIYQDGFGIMLGATVGYQLPLSEKLNLDFFLGAGTVQSFYKGKHKFIDVRYDEMTGWNKSGEFLPYRGGVMLSYKLK